MKPGAYPKLALSLPEASQGSHMDHSDLRFAGKIFALHADWPGGWGNAAPKPLLKAHPQ